MDADILCLQELDKADYNGAFGTGLGQLGYRGLYQKRTADLEHGFAIFYRYARITEVQCNFVSCPDKEVVSGVECAGILAVLDIANVLAGDLNAVGDSLLVEY
ncbi:hypothetical protein BGZ70_000797 [Mortierella alpina]|uniref:Endonuclease/exonuclease/phosphatase domain-containing protein n=1 Tax=Mortierella alpina TaxID=64518 RepID=A0A9P6IXA3_MORAP|nr:hypothetical protein BGZ70_000797 [Mortierella alpina]